MENKTVEGYYSTYGNCGQHSAQRVLVLRDGELKPADHVWPTKNEDCHSSKNYHFARVYTVNPQDSWVRVWCYASSSGHKPRKCGAEAHGELEVREELNGYVVYHKGKPIWWLPVCVRGRPDSPLGKPYEARMAEVRAREELERKKREEELRKQVAPVITVSKNNGRWEFVGDTYHHRAALKAIGCRWDALSKVWYCTAEPDLQKLRGLLPEKAEVREA